MADDHVQLLRDEVMQYKTADDAIIALNRQLGPLRETRNLVKDRIVAIINQPAFANISELAIAQDGSKIRIRRPGWNAPWSLPKMRMYDLIREYFNTAGPHNANSCIAFINQRQMATLRKETFDIERVVRE